MYAIHEYSLKQSVGSRKGQRTKFPHSLSHHYGAARISQPRHWDLPPPMQWAFEGVFSGHDVTFSYSCRLAFEAVNIALLVVNSTSKAFGIPLFHICHLLKNSTKMQ